MGKVLSPWQPIEAAQTGGCVELGFTGRRVAQDGALMPTSLQTLGQELLYAPIRLTGVENGEPLAWAEEGCYLLAPSEDAATVNGFAQSGCVVANTTLRWEYDGAARWDIKVMPRGLTVPQVFGLEECPIKAWDLTRLHLEIPLRKDAVRLYVSWPQGGARALRDGAALSENGRIPEGGMTMPFKAGLWLGTERSGVQIVAESDETWQSERRDRAIEILDKGTHWVLSLRLLDALPRTWTPADARSPHVCFSLGLVLTPVKPIDPAFLKVRAVHIDCFTKIKGDYWPFLNGPVSDENPETVIDRLSRAGVNLLILHEKWNKIQNYWGTAVQTRDEITKLVRLCHARGIRVIPYFGYEITSPMPEFTNLRDDVVWHPEGGRGNSSDWYRVPYQRATKACYGSAWRDTLVAGILQCVDDFRFDGVYLDTTTAPFACVNARHGCGYTDENGETHGTYPVFATRDMLKKICEGIHARGGIVNPHPSGATLPFITSFSDMLWDGEHIQTKIWKDGLNDFPLDYFRAEYLGTNLGIPVQFIVYEVPGVWSFDMALSVCLIHGVYPRPNAVGHPLDVMETIWRALSLYGAADAAFFGYWENARACAASRPEVRVSYYRREQLDGGVRLLALVGNPTGADCADARVHFDPKALGASRVRSAFDAVNRRFVTISDAGARADADADIPVPLSAYGYAVLEIVLD